MFYALSWINVVLTEDALLFRGDGSVEIPRSAGAFSWLSWLNVCIFHRRCVAVLLRAVEVPRSAGVFVLAQRMYISWKVRCRSAVAELSRFLEAQMFFLGST